ncbi:MAG: mechanosensitive ion channel [Desulfovibrionaceae bacterium]|nr:mechanosensitive ion channel [Desulfovibrionaceae bacterium]
MDSIQDAIGRIPYAQDALEAAILLLAAAVSYLAAKRIMIRAVNNLCARTKTRFDDLLVKNRFFERAAHLAPAAVIYWGTELFPRHQADMRKALSVYVVVIAALVVDKLLSSLSDLYQTFEVSHRRPIKGYVQLAKIFIFVIAAVVALSVVLDKSPWGLLSGIGALTAVLMLVFKDTILSFVAGIHISGNDLLRKGDWIEMPSMGADGDVIDVALHTVKVQNFDKTVVAIPTHKFLDSSFKNWRGMKDAGCRRVKRSVLLDQSSVRFADQSMLDKLRRLRLLAAHIEAKERDIAEYNQRIGADRDLTMDGRQLTNIGLFRAYVLNYLKNHPLIRQDLTLMVRQLQPSASEGLPLEIYCFVADTDWTRYEAVQSDIFDHILAAIPDFGLRAYQRNALVDARSTC